MEKSDAVQRALALIASSVARREYFFTHVTSPTWLEPLRDAGYFTEPPAAVSEDGGVRHPTWCESGYLARVAEHDAGHSVLADILESLPATDNVRVRDDIIQAGLKVPPSLLREWARRQVEWVKGLDALGLALPSRLSQLIAHMATGGEVDTALRLFDATFGPVASTTDADDGDVWGDARETHVRMTPWEYADGMTATLPALAGSAGMRLVDLLADYLEASLRHRMAATRERANAMLASLPELLDVKDVEDGVEDGSAESRPTSDDAESGPPDVEADDDEFDRTVDYSYIWRPAIEDHENNIPGRVMDTLVTATRDAAVAAAAAAPSCLDDLVDSLHARGWDLFRRIALHVVGSQADTMPETALARILSPDDLYSLAAKHEYSRVLRQGFGRLSAGDKQAWLRLVESGPEKLRGDDDDAKRHLKQWQTQRLRWVQEHLSPAAGDWYADLIDDAPADAEDGFVRTVTRREGPNSPLDVSELKELSVAYIVAELDRFQPPGDPMDDSREGLGRALGSVVADEPGRIAAEIELFQGVEAIYARHLLHGFREAGQDALTGLWDPILRFCHWVVDQPRDSSDSDDQDRDSDPHWGWARKTVADLLAQGFNEGVGCVPFELRSAAWDVLEPITSDPDPGLDREQGEDAMAPSMLTINTTRGQAMHAVIAYATWVHRHLADERGSPNAVSMSDMDEVRAVLEERLDTGTETTATIRSVYGQSYPWLWMIDEGWAHANVGSIFPLDDRLREAAWDAYLTFCRPYDTVYDALSGLYQQSVDALDPESDDDAGTEGYESDLAEHLATYYWRGVIPSGAAVWTTFWDRAPAETRAHAVRYIGLSVGATAGEMPVDVRERLEALWDTRLAWASPNSDDDDPELPEFGRWFASGKFDNPWALERLHDTIDIVPDTESDKEVLQRLAELADDYPDLCMKCLDRLVKGDEKAWGVLVWKQEVRDVLTPLVDSGVQAVAERAVDLIHYLGSLGQYEYRDLLPS
jgi:hypothetical protein